MKNSKLLILAFVTIMVIQSCGPAEGDNTGHEYIPDMGHSVALEANTYNYYHHNTWDEASTITLAELVKNPALPVAGTIPRGYAGGHDMGAHGDQVTDMRIKPNGSVPYYYEDTEEDRARAMAEIQANPFPITADGLERGKELYDIFCGVCHGEKADGLGYLYDTDVNSNAKFPLAPANLLNEEFSAASNGRYYHTIMYGRNLGMGGYADKINYEERWQVIHYIRSLQAKEAGLAYDEEENTYNPVFGTPEAMMSAMADQMEAELHTDEEHGDEEIHEDHGEAAPADHSNESDH